MSQKRKRGLQSGLSEIVARQTAPVPDKSKESSNLIAKFREQPQVNDLSGDAINETAGTPLPPPPTSLQPTETSSTPIAPARDFTRVANSITRDAMPGGLFKGISKKLYDALYLRTRGAVVPQREIKARQSDLRQWAGVSRNTLRAHIHHLEAVRLIEIKWELGDNDGAIYEVRLPEEVYLPPPPTTSLQPPPTSNQKLGGPSPRNWYWVEGVNPLIILTLIAILRLSLRLILSGAMMMTLPRSPDWSNLSNKSQKKSQAKNYHPQSASVGRNLPMS